MRMRRMWLLGLALLTLATGPFASSASAADQIDPWRAFAERAELNAVLDRYNVLSDLGYLSNELDAKRCAAQASTLESALIAVPLSAALHRAALMCAEARGDDAREHAVLLWGARLYYLGRPVGAAVA